MRKFLMSVRLREDAYQIVKDRAAREYRSMSNALELELLEGLVAAQKLPPTATSRQNKGGPAGT